MNAPTNRNLTSREQREARKARKDTREASRRAAVMRRRERAAKYAVQGRDWKGKAA